MSSSRESEGDRLQDAIDAYLAYRGRRGESVEDFLAAHERLRDLLEPMLAAEAEAEAEDGLVAEPEADFASGSLADRSGGKYLGDFRLLREIGRGGMGVVYEAEQVSLSRRVALKVLSAHLTLAPRQIERFRREAAAAAKLEHPGIIPIYGVGEEAGTHFFAMEFVEGESLYDVIERIKKATQSSEGVSARIGILDHSSYAGEVAEIGAQIAEALHFAHEHGVVHRDIKPPNILLGQDKKVRIVDFGLARDEDREGLTQTGEFAGTPFYVSPEQASGSQGNVDCRSDVFSLGVVLYECSRSTGRSMARARRRSCRVSRPMNLDLRAGSIGKSRATLKSSA